MYEPEPIDRKFKILAVNQCKTGAVYTEMDGFFFKAVDKHALAALDGYIAAISEDKAVGDEQVRGAELLRERVALHQHKFGTKVPDVDAGIEAGTVLMPNKNVYERR